MQKPITIRFAEAKDREDLTTLLSSARLPIEDLPITLTDFLIASEADEISGVVGAELYPPYALLRSLIVREEMRGKDLGKNLVSKLEAHLASKNITSIYLLTETAELFFLKRGYRSISREYAPEEIRASSEFSHVCPQSAVLMVKKMDV